jgi:molybdopterin-containing oxidoreductase family membrane subunit
MHVVERINDDLLRPVLKTSWKFYALVLVCGTVVAWALFAWGWQLAHGIGVTGKRRPEFWSLYITNFVFWIGISHAGTLISAILRVTNAGWRRPVPGAVFSNC